MTKEKTNLGKMIFYCDESCHLKDDDSKYMAIASVYCRKDRAKAINAEIKKIKERHNISAKTELKWNKVSSATLDMYKEIFRFIKDNSKLKIRILIADKSLNENTNEWYNKVYYKLIEFPLQSILWNYDIDKIEILSDKKDSNSYKDMKTISRYLTKHFAKKYSVQFESKVCESYDVQLIQIADILAGAATYKMRKLHTSSNGSVAKKELIKFIETTFNISFNKNTKFTYGEISHYNVYIFEKETENDF